MDALEQARAAATGLGDTPIERLAERVGGRVKVEAVFRSAGAARLRDVIPVARIRWGVGGGGGESVAEGAQGSGGGGGVAADAIGYIEITDAGATFRRIRPPCAKPGPHPGLRVRSSGRDLRAREAPALNGRRALDASAARARQCSRDASSNTRVGPENPFRTTSRPPSNAKPRALPKSRTTSDVRMRPASAASQIRLARVTVEPNRSSLWSTGSPAATPIRTRSSGVRPSADRAGNPAWMAKEHRSALATSSTKP